MSIQAPFIAFIISLVLAFLVIVGIKKKIDLWIIADLFLLGLLVTMGVLLGIAIYM